MIVPFTHLRRIEDVATFLRASAPTTPAGRLAAVRTATRRMLREYGVDGSIWSVSYLPRGVRTTYGRVIYANTSVRYSPKLLETWDVDAIAATIVHEVAHVLTYTERRRQGLPGFGGHDKMWRGLAAALGLPGAQARNLPTAAGGTR